jgi:hypothetical protein
MARRNYGRRSTYAGYAPPAAIVAAVPTLNLAGLTAAYEWMSVDRLTSLKLAHEWYAEAICPANGPSPLLYQAALNPAQQKSYDMAVKVKGVGDSTPYPQEKATFLEKAIRLYEQIWSGKSLPKVDDAVAPGQNVTNVQRVLANFNDAFKSFGVNFRMTFNADREFLEGEILVPRTELNLMVGEPPLKTILAEATTVARFVSIATDVNGEQAFDGNKFMETLPNVLNAVYAWAAGSDKVMKPVGKPVAAAGAKASRASGNRAARVAPNGALPRDKGAAALALMRQPGGATVNSLLAATGWTLGSLQSFVSNTRKKGIVINASNAGGAKTYSA